MLIGTGVSLEHFVSSTVSWVRASIEFDKWIVEQLGLEAEIEGDSDKKPVTTRPEAVHPPPGCAGPRSDRLRGPASV